MDKLILPDGLAKRGPWVHFWDMHSGGDNKIGTYEHIYIQAGLKPSATAITASATEIFERLFGRDPDNVTCSCCGNDFSIDEDDNLYQVTGYDRGCTTDSNGKYVEYPAKTKYARKYVSLHDYIQQEDVCIVYSDHGTMTILRSNEEVLRNG